MSDEFCIPDQALPAFRTAFDQLMPQDQTLVKRYEFAIDQLSENDPITAFEFRARGSISDFFTNLRQFILSQGPAPPELELVERQLRELIIPKLNDAVVALARLHGRSTKRRVEAIVKRETEVPPELQNLIETLQAKTRSPS
jgi:hypothetical protein